MEHGSWKILIIAVLQADKMILLLILPTASATIKSLLSRINVVLRVSSIDFLTNWLRLHPTASTSMASATTITATTSGASSVYLSASAR